MAFRVFQKRERGQTKGVPKLNLENVTKTFGATAAVEGVSFSVDAGQYVTLTGPSGGGKTTLLRLIAGLETPDSGCIAVDGCPVTQLGAGDRKIAMLFQGNTLYPNLSVEDNLGLGLRLRRVAGIERRKKVAAMAKTLELSRLLHRLPENLSGGERQRTALGQALLQEPRVLLLDEPFSDLDGPLRKTLREELRCWHRELGLTVIHVTHDHQEAMALGAQIGFIHQGKLHQYATPEAVYRRPHSRCVAEFFGNPPMNLILGCLDTDGTNRKFQFGPDSADQITGVPSYFAPKLSKGEVIAGWRPEDLGLDLQLAPAGGTGLIRAIVASTEFGGAQTWVHLDLGKQVMTVRYTGENRIASGDTVWVRPDWSRAACFDVETGSALPLDPNSPCTGKPDSVSR
jgi:ABC-type sugar transport system ATPase subunit